MKKIYLFGILIFMLSGVNSQVNYTFSATTGTFVAVAGGTASTLTAVNAGFPPTDEGFQNGIPIGFTFRYNGTNYTTINLHTNGFASFAPFATIADPSMEDYYFDDLENGPYVIPDIRPVLAPLWDDLDLVSAANIKYTTTGTAPNRVFTIEWLNARWDYTATASVISFQLRLFETTNVVEFIYRSEAGAKAQDVSTDGASIGITSTAYGNGSYIALTNTSATPGTSSTDSVANLKIKPATGQIYRFTPNVSLPISLIGFKAEKMSGLNRINWTTASEQNNKGFELQRSADGKNFATLNFVESKSSTGNSTSTLNYVFDDVRPLRGSSFYRLKQIDKDNKSIYSQIVMLKGTVAPRLEVRNIFPNPAVSVLNLIVSLPDNDKLNLIVADLNGRVVMVKTVDATIGDNSINLNVSRLAAGNYTIKAQCTNGCEPVSARFVKN